MQRDIKVAGVHYMHDRNIIKLSLLRHTPANEGANDGSEECETKMFTLAPSLCQTDPSSTPMTPAPIRVRDLGMDFRDRAPVDDTIVSSST